MVTDSDPVAEAGYRFMTRLLNLYMQLVLILHYYIAVCWVGSSLPGSREAFSKHGDCRPKSTGTGLLQIANCTIYICHAELQICWVAITHSIQTASVPKSAIQVRFQEPMSGTRAYYCKEWKIHHERPYILAYRHGWQPHVCNNEWAQNEPKGPEPSWVQANCHQSQGLMRLGFRSPS